MPDVETKNVEILRSYDIPKSCEHLYIMLNGLVLPPKLPVGQPIDFTTECHAFCLADAHDLDKQVREMMDLARDSTPSVFVGALVRVGDQVLDRVFPTQFTMVGQDKLRFLFNIEWNAIVSAMPTGRGHTPAALHLDDYGIMNHDS